MRLKDTLAFALLRAKYIRAVAACPMLRVFLCVYALNLLL